MMTLITAIVYAVSTMSAYFIGGQDVALAMGIGMFIGLCNAWAVVHWKLRSM